MHLVSREHVMSSLNLCSSDPWTVLRHSGTRNLEQLGGFPRSLAHSCLSNGAADNTFQQLPLCGLWARYVQRDPGALAQGFVDLDLGSSPGWWAATLATYCPSRMVEHPKYMSTKPCARPPGSRCISVKERKVDLGLVVGIFSCLMYFRWGRKENKCLYYLGLAHTIWGIIKVSLIKSILKQSRSTCINFTSSYLPKIMFPAERASEEDARRDRGTVLPGNCDRAGTGQKCHNKR